MASCPSLSVRSRRAPPVPLIVLPKSCSCRWGPCPPPSLVSVFVFFLFYRADSLSELLQRHNNEQAWPGLLHQHAAQCTHSHRHKHGPFPTTNLLLYARPYNSNSSSHYWYGEREGPHRTWTCSNLRLTHHLLRALGDQKEADRGREHDLDQRHRAEEV